MSARDFSCRFWPVDAIDGLAVSRAVVDKRIDCFLKHAFFVACDDLRRVEFDQALQAVVTVDDAAVQVVQIGCRKPAAVECNHRPEVRRDDRDGGENHPFGPDTVDLQVLDELQATDETVVSCSCCF